MNQDATWYGSRPRPRRRCVRWGQRPPKRGTPPTFGPCLLWPNGRPSQLLVSCLFFHTKPTDWLGGRLRHDLFCVEWDVKPEFNQSCLSRSEKYVVCVDLQDKNSSAAPLFGYTSLTVGLSNRSFTVLPRF